MRAVVAAALHFLETPFGRDRPGSLEPRTAFGMKPNPGKNLIRFHDDVVAALDPLDPRCPIAEGRTMRVCH